MRRRARQRESKRQVGSAVASSGDSALSSRSRRTMRRSVPTITAARRVGRSERDELIRVMDDGEKLGLLTWLLVAIAPGHRIGTGVAANFGDIPPSEGGQPW